MSVDPTLVIVGLFGLAFLGVILVLVRDTRKYRTNVGALETMCSERGWSYNPKGTAEIGDLITAPDLIRFWPYIGSATIDHQVDGTFAGRKFSAFTFVTPSANTPSFRGVVVLQLPFRCPTALCVRRASMIGRALFGARPRNLTTGDTEFDRTFDVECDDPQWANRLLQPSVMARMLGQPDVLWVFYADRAIALYQKDQRLDTPQFAGEIEERLTALIEVCSGFQAP